MTPPTSQSRWSKATGKIPTGRQRRTRLPGASTAACSRPRASRRAAFLETADVSAQAAGRMHMVEDMVTGAARITLEDGGHVDLERGGLAMTARRARRSSWGLTTDLTTARRRSPSSAEVPPALDVVAADRPRRRAGVDRGPGCPSRTPRITVRPGLPGDPYVVTHGAAFADRARADRTARRRLASSIHDLPGDSAGA